MTYPDEAVLFEVLDPCGSKVPAGEVVELCGEPEVWNPFGECCCGPVVVQFHCRHAFGNPTYSHAFGDYWAFSSSNVRALTPAAHDFLRYVCEEMEFTTYPRPELPQLD